MCILNHLRGCHSITSITCISYSTYLVIHWKTSKPHNYFDIVLLGFLTLYERYRSVTRTKGQQLWGRKNNIQSLEDFTPILLSIKTTQKCWLHRLDMGKHFVTNIIRSDGYILWKHLKTFVAKTCFFKSLWKPSCFFLIE